MGRYTPAGSIFEKPALEKDLGVIISTDPKPALLCQAAAKKANSVPGRMACPYKGQESLMKSLQGLSWTYFRILCASVDTMDCQRYKSVGGCSEKSNKNDVWSKGTHLKRN